MAEPPHPDPEARTEAAPLAAVPSIAAAYGMPESPSGVTLDGDTGPALVGDRYEILGMLGSGGMGTVYRARDRELDEIVALKVLKKELASASGMLERFRREVKLARRVTHKNVARTFDIGDHAGDRFLTMELIEGEMLGAHLARRGRVPLHDVVRIGIEVCAGLAAAHAAGVLHRDLKPENVILARDGRAVITDFGIARALASAELGAARTAAGMVGTPAYMAPEQVEGAADLDARADLYALGTMLFELVTGKPAWPGDTVIAIAAGRILRPPPDARTHLPDFPEDAALLLLKLMARARDDRFATAEEASHALASLTISDAPSARSLAPRSMSPGGSPTTGSGTVVMGATPHATRKTVAVLPLVNLGVEDDAYLAQTVTEDLVDLLSMVRDLRVRPRGETAPFSSANRDVREVGRSLGVDVVVDGSLRRIGDLVRTSVRLVTVEDGFQLWARRFDCPAAQVLTVADDAAAAIAGALATELAPAGARVAIGDAVAQDSYLRGRYLVNRGWFDVSEHGVQLLGEAYQRAPDDPRIAGTYALAIARVVSGDPTASKKLATPDPRELADKTLLLDPLQVQARVALGFVHLNDAEAVTAATLLKRALALAPNAVEALDVVGRILIEVGRWELGIATLRRALSIDSSLGQARQSIGRAYALAGDYDSALEALGPFPTGADVPPYVLIRGRMALWRRDREGARALVEELATSGVAETAKFRMKALLSIAVTGELTDEIKAQADKSLSLDPAFQPRRVSFHAQVRTELKLGGGRIEEALDDLRVADSNGLLDLMWLERCPLFDLVSDRPEYIAIHKSTRARAERVIEILDPKSAANQPPGRSFA